MQGLSSNHGQDADLVRLFNRRHTDASCHLYLPRRARQDLNLRSFVDLNVLPLLAASGSIVRGSPKRKSKANASAMSVITESAPSDGSPSSSLKKYATHRTARGLRVTAIRGRGGPPKLVLWLEGPSQKFARLPKSSPLNLASPRVDPDHGVAWHPYLSLHDERVHGRHCSGQRGLRVAVVSAAVGVFVFWLRSRRDRSIIRCLLEDYFVERFAAEELGRRMRAHVGRRITAAMSSSHGSSLSSSAP
jgi:hypothetical protein